MKTFPIPSKPFRESNAPLFVGGYQPKASFGAHRVLPCGERGVTLWAGKWSLCFDVRGFEIHYGNCSDAPLLQFNLWKE